MIKKMFFIVVNEIKTVFNFVDTYLLVAGAFHDMEKPMMNKTSPCKNVVDGLSGKTSSKIAARGTAEAELI
uniref:Uncharacterized protein n=1 Tax=Cucumis melo TaxID=3656 RepID=A0A9I9EFA8_CUCME